MRRWPPAKEIKVKLEVRKLESVHDTEKTLGFGRNYQAARHSDRARSLSVRWEEPMIRNKAADAAVFAKITADMGFDAAEGHARGAGEI